MRRAFVLITVTAFVLSMAAPLTAQQPDPGQHHGAPQKPAAPGGMGQGMMGGMGMMSGGICPMMGGMTAMMGGPTDPKAMGRMLQMRGEMMKAMGEIMMKHGKMMEPGN